MVSNGEFYARKMKDLIAEAASVGVKLMQTEQGVKWDQQEYPPLTRSLLDEAEQEGEKWTHTYGGDVCRIVHQVGGDAWVEFKAKLGGLVVRVERLKPIKPTLTKSEAWDKAVLAGNMSHITDSYDII